MNPALAAIVRPLLGAWLHATTGNWADVPRPEGSTTVHAGGDNPLRLLHFGGGLAVGHGVLTHDLALPGNFARMISAALRRGVDVDVLAVSGMTARNASEHLSAVTLRRYDGVIVTLGVQDALQIIPHSLWREYFSSFVARLVAESGGSVPIFIVEIPALSHVLRLNSLSGWILDREARALNEMLREASDAHPSVTAVPFDPPRVMEKDRHRGPTTYRAWAALMVPPIVASLKLRR